MPFKYKILIPWPRPPEFETTDPNAAWREWLETNVGKQIDTWDWNASVNHNAVLLMLNDIQAAIEFKLRWTTIG